MYVDMTEYLWDKSCILVNIASTVVQSLVRRCSSWREQTYTTLRIARTHFVTLLVALVSTLKLPHAVYSCKKLDQATPPPHYIAEDDIT